MSNLFDQTPQNIEEFNPAADNRPKKATSSAGGTVVYCLTLGLFTLGIHYVLTRNKLLKLQNQINKSSSLIDVQLTKRYDTLTKLVDAVSSYKKFEAQTFEEIARMRSLVQQGGIENASEIEQLNSNVFGRLFAVSENYPELKASALYQDLMEQTSYLENEIAAARRIYNTDVNDFNTLLFTWPSSVIAAQMKLSTKPLYQSSAKQREDVSFSKLD